MESFRSAESGIHHWEDEQKERGGAVVSVQQNSVKLGRLCPMCEASFPLEHMEEFETHVMDHFSYDSDPDTLQYVVPDDREGHQ